MNPYHDVELIDSQTIDRLTHEVGESVLKQLLGLFLHETEAYFADLEDNLSLEGIAELTRLLHSIKSGAKTYGANRLADICEELESRSRALDFKKVESSMALLRQVWADTQGAFTRLCNT